MNLTTIRNIIIYLIILSLAVFAAACAQQPQADKEEIQILLDWFPNTNHSGLYAAREQGFYHDQDLEVDIIQAGETGVVQLVATGNADFGISYQEEVTIARSLNIPVIAIATIIQNNTSGFASKKEKNILSPQDFAFKNYGGWGSPSETAILKALMEKYDADFEELNMINIGTADFFTSMERDIDFAWIYYGWTGIEAELRGIDLNFIPIKDENEALNFYTPVIITSESFLAQNEATVKKFLKATAQGYEYAIEKPVETATIMHNLFPELNPDLLLASQNYLATQYRADAPRWGEMSLERWKNYTEFMSDYGLLQHPMDPARAFTNDYLP